MRILVVEDDKNLNAQISAALLDAGYVVDKAFDGEEGHYLGETEPYDAVILDIGLPKMDGISVLEAWRQESITLGKMVTVIGHDTSYVGKAIDIDAEGALLVETDTGVERVLAGDVSIRPAER